MAKQTTPFSLAVIKTVSQIPKGKLASYGQIAAYIGIPRAAIQVGVALKNTDSSVDLPWWRVINNSGRISIKNNFEYDAISQKELIESDGIYVSNDFSIDLEKYRWAPSTDQLSKFRMNLESKDILLSRI